MAPAQELFISARVACPSSMIFSAPMTSGRNSSGRRPIKACVAMAVSASCGRSALPKPVSRPQIETMMLAGTLILLLHGGKVGSRIASSWRGQWRRARERRLVEIVFRDVELRLMHGLRHRAIAAAQVRRARPGSAARDAAGTSRASRLQLSVEGLARDAGGFRLGPEILQPFGEALLDLALIGRDRRVGLRVRARHFGRNRKRSKSRKPSQTDRKSQACDCRAFGQGPRPEKAQRFHCRADRRALVGRVAKPG